jgi:hypothetical protein
MSSTILGCKFVFNKLACIALASNVLLSLQQLLSAKWLHTWLEIEFLRVELNAISFLTNPATTFHSNKIIILPCPSVMIGLNLYVLMVLKFQHVLPTLWNPQVVGVKEEPISQRTISKFHRTTTFCSQLSCCKCKKLEHTFRDQLR